MRAPRTISEQFEFNFENQSEKPDPLIAWRASRRNDVEKLCQRLGLPVGDLAEVRLNDGRTLRGVLQLPEGKSWEGADRETVMLEIDGTTFRFADVSSATRVVRTDLFD